MVLYIIKIHSNFFFNFFFVVPVNSSNFWFPHDAERVNITKKFSGQFKVSRFLLSKKAQPFKLRADLDVSGASQGLRNEFEI